LEIGNSVVSGSETRAVVEEHSLCAEVGLARAHGAQRRETVGMSNRNLGESPRGRKPKVSWAMTINPGLGGP